MQSYHARSCNRHTLLTIRLLLRRLGLDALAGLGDSLGGDPKSLECSVPQPVVDLLLRKFKNWRKAN